jgi:hypothetical protein
MNEKYSMRLIVGRSYVIYDEVIEMLFDFTISRDGYLYFNWGEYFNRGDVPHDAYNENKTTLGIEFDSNFIFLGEL